MTEPVDFEAPMTVDEVAALFGVSRSTISRMTREGHLGKIPGMRRIRIPRAAVRAILEGYDALDEPDREASSKASPSRRGNGGQDRMGRAIG